MDEDFDISFDVDLNPSRGVYAASMYILYQFDNDLDTYSHFTLAGYWDEDASSHSFQAGVVDSGTTLSLYKDPVENYDYQARRVEVSWNADAGNFEQIYFAGLRFPHDVTVPSYIRSAGGQKARICFGAQTTKIDSLAGVSARFLNLSHTFNSVAGSRVDPVPFQDGNQAVAASVLDSRYNVDIQGVDSVYFENAGGVSFEPVKYVWVDDTFVEFTPDDLYIQILETGFDEYATVYSTEPIATTADSPPEHFYYVADQVGQPVQVAAADGTLAWEATHSPFGEKSTISVGSDFHQPLRFPGQYLDEETSLHYNWNRYYDPGLGMYTQADRIVGRTNGIWLALYIDEPERSSAYQYVGGEPLGRFDDNGLAYVARRKLSWARRVFNNTSDSRKDNQAGFHSQIFFEDEEGGDIGFTTSGLPCGDEGAFLVDDPIGGYELIDSGPQARTFDDKILRDAVEVIKKRYEGTDYCVIGNNCQDFVEDVVNEYDRRSAPKP